MMTLDDLRQWLLHYEWRSTFDDRMLQRGLDYAARRRVLELELQAADPQGALLRGAVAGSGGRRYECEIRLVPQDRWLLLETDCTCPVGAECKHAAAMLLSVMTGAAMPAPVPAVPLPAPPDWQAIAAARQAEAELSSWDHWLASLDRMAKTAPPVEPGRCFGILLRGSDQGDRLLALPVWLRPSKSRAAHHSWVDPQPLRSSERFGPVPAPPDGWPEPAATALALLLAAPPVSFGNLAWAAVRSVQAERALEYLLAHYPAWYERGNQPLERGPALAARLEWVPADDGSQRLQMRLDAPDARLLRGDGLWYVQPQARRYGRVEGDAQLLERLLDAPALKLPQLATVRQRLASSNAARHLPAPIEYGPARNVCAPPVPVLRLHPDSMRRWNGPVCRIGVATLRFEHDGHAVTTHESALLVTRLERGRLIEIHRDPTAEQRWQQSLRQLGLAPLSTLDTGYLTNSRDHSDDWFARTSTRRTPLAPEDWAPLVTRLERAGFHIEYAADFPHEQLLAIDDWRAELTPTGHAWFDVTLGVEIAGERIDLLPILRQLVADPTFPRPPAPREKKDACWRIPLDDTRSIELPLARLRALIEPLLEWLESEPAGAPRVHRSQAAELDATGLPWRGGEALRALLAQLRARPPAKPPRGFKATLRPYQRDGLAWLDFLGAAGLGGILADDMGLGKTVQVLAHLLGEKQRGRLNEPALVVAPTSLVGNWASEAARFAPGLKVLILHGSDRADRYDGIADHDLVVTTYPLLPRDRDKLVEATFALLVLDEAQAIKNATSQAAQVVREIPAARRLAMTGTPLENHLGELWAQFDVVEPGLLGSQRQFARFYRTPIEKHGDRERQQRLNRRIGPLLLRRRKDDVLADLPPKTEIVRTLELEDEQRALYETLRLAQHERVRQAVKERGLAQSGIVVLDALLKLRQACCDPRLVKLDSAKKVKTSAKLDALLELLGNLVDDGRRVLLFSQFTEMLALIEVALRQRGLAHHTLTGQTPAHERTALVRRFQQGEVPLLLISLKAGGTGLNLTAADAVIHYDPWWNPAVEAQATDRAHRIGQDKPVFVYRLICKDTVEEKIQAMQERKAGLAQAVLEGGGSTQRLRFDERDLEALFGQ
jgi:superfamily II DNA or RNA helicase